MEYAGARPDPALARQRYDLILEGFGVELHFVCEPLGAAHSYAARLVKPATILVADFGGGTTDFSIVRVAAPGSKQRCVPLTELVTVTPALPKGWTAGRKASRI